MNIQKKHDDKLVILIPEGRIDSVSSEVFGNMIQELFEQGKTRVVVNFSQTSFVSSAGLRVLLMAVKTTRRLEPEPGVLALCHMNETIQDIFDVSGFSTLFSIFPTEAEARAFAADHQMPAV